MKYFSKYRKKMARAILSLLLLCFIVSYTSISSHAAPSWIRAGEAEVYGDTEREEIVPDTDQEVKKDSIIKHMDNLFDYVTRYSTEMLNPNSSFDLSLNGIVLGRAGGYDISVAKFELYENNPYGVVGAYGYVIFRNITYSLMVVYFLWSLFKNALHSGSNNRRELKEDVYSALMIIVLLQFLPAVVNWITTIRDSLIHSIAGMATQSTGSGLVELNEIIKGFSYADERSDFILSILSLAYACAGIFYVGAYVLVALQSMALFIGIPYAVLKSFKDKRFLEGWLMKLLANLMVPLIDYVFLLTPLLIRFTFSALGADFTNGIKEKNALGVISIMIVWSVIPARNYVMGVLGNGGGGARAGGFGLAALAMGARMLTGSGKSGGGSVNSGDGKGLMSDLTNAERYNAMGNDLEKSLEEMKEIRPWEELLNDSGKGDVTPKVTDVDQMLNGEDKVSVKTEEEETINNEFENDESKSLEENDLGIEPDGIKKFTDDSDIDPDIPDNFDENFDDFENAKKFEEIKPGEDDTSTVTKNEAQNDPDSQGSQEMNTVESDDSTVNGERIELSDMETPEATKAKDGFDEYYDESILESPIMSDEVDELTNKPFDALSQSEKFDYLREKNLERMDELRGQMEGTNDSIGLKTEVTQLEEKMKDMSEGKVAERKEAIQKKNTAIDKNQSAIDDTRVKIKDLETQMEKDFPEVNDAFDLPVDERKPYVEAKAKIARYEDNIKKWEDENLKLREEIKTIESKPVAYDEGEYKKVASEYSKKRTQLEAVQSEFEKRSQRELSFAEKNNIYRNDDTVYQNAESFRDVRINNERLRRQANYRNFDSSSIAPSFAPKDMADYYRERAVTNVAINVAKKTAAAAGGVVAGAAMLAGGEQATMMGALMGGQLASNAVGGAISGAQSVGDYRKAKEELTYGYSDTTGGKTTMPPEAQDVEQEVVPENPKRMNPKVQPGKRVTSDQQSFNHKNVKDSTAKVILDDIRNKGK